MAIRSALARYISLVLNPLVIFAALAALAVVRDIPEHPVLFLAVGLLFGAVLPLVYVWHLYRRGIIDGFFVSERRLRLRPLWVAAVGCWTGVVVLWAMDAPIALLAVMVSFAAQAVVMLGLTGRTKVSLHAGAAWSGWVLVWIFYGTPALVLLPVPLLVGWARLVLGAHTMGQVVLGGCTGGVLTWGICFFLLG